MHYEVDLQFVVQSVSWKEQFTTVGTSNIFKRFCRMSSPIVKISEGKLKGSVHETIDGFRFHTFLGIPYAKAPVGNLRFKDPQPPEKWTGIRDATVQGNVNSQYIISKKTYIGDEDSLFLNVSVPSLATIESKLPVLCYIHGGGFYLGDGTFEHLRPDFLVEKDVIVVTCNYRLGILGFLCLNTPEVPGNAGLKDQVIVLRWIQKNISSFGGDPENVTLVGESAGSACVHYHMMSNMSKGLFKRTIMQSGTCISEWAKQKSPEKHAFIIAEKLGMEKTSSKERLLEFLQNVTAENLTRESIIDFDYHMDIWFCGVVERNFPNVEPFLTDYPIDMIERGIYNAVPSIIGVCSHEALLFLSPKILEAHAKGEFRFSLGDMKALIKRHFLLDVTDEDVKKARNFYMKDDENLMAGFIDFVSDMFFTKTAATSVKMMSRFNDAVFYYLYGFCGKLNRVTPSTAFSYNGAGHADDDSYIFKKENDNVELQPSDLLNRRRLVTMWTNFVKFGNPTPQRDNIISEIWKPATEINMNCLQIKNDLEIIENPFSNRHSFLDLMFSKYLKNN